MLLVYHSFITSNMLAKFLGCESFLNFGGNKNEEQSKNITLWKKSTYKSYNKR